jgi:hypothetical protein
LLLVFEINRSGPELASVTMRNVCAHEVARRGRARPLVSTWHQAGFSCPRCQSPAQGREIPPQVRRNPAPGTGNPAPGTGNPRRGSGKSGRVNGKSRPGAGYPAKESGNPAKESGNLALASLTLLSRRPGRSPEVHDLQAAPQKLWGGPGGPKLGRPEAAKPGRPEAQSSAGAPKWTISGRPDAQTRPHPLSESEPRVSSGQPARAHPHPNLGDRIRVSVGPAPALPQLESLRIWPELARTRSFSMADQRT